MFACTFLSKGSPKLLITLAVSLFLMPTEYANAQIDTLKKYYLNGNTAYIMLLDSSGLTLSATYFWENGLVQSKQEFSADRGHKRSFCFDSSGHKTLEIINQKNDKKQCIKKYHPNGRTRSIEINRSKSNKTLKYNRLGSLVEKASYKRGYPVFCFVRAALDSSFDPEDIYCVCRGVQVFWDSTYYLDAQGNRINQRFVFKRTSYHPNGRLKRRVKQRKLLRKAKNWDSTGVRLSDSTLGIQASPHIWYEQKNTASMQLLLPMAALYDSPNPLVDTVILSYGYDFLDDSTAKFAVSQVFYDSLGTQTPEFSELIATRIEPTSSLNADFQWYKHGMIRIGILKKTMRHLTFHVNEDPFWKSIIPDRVLLEATQ